jgi:plasmid maintenance system antidote protein VapI
MPVIKYNHNLTKVCKRQYRNPIYLARDWRKALDDGKFSSPAELACHLKVSRARVTQILNLLKLTPEVIERISLLGDPITSSAVFEKRLRPLLALTADQQKAQVEIMLAKNMYNQP